LGEAGFQAVDMVCRRQSLTIINIHGNRAPGQNCLGLEWWCCVRLAVRAVAGSRLLELTEFIVVKPCDMALLA
jgi:hypothetical protein